MSVVRIKKCVIYYDMCDVCAIFVNGSIVMCAVLIRLFSMQVPDTLCLSVLHFSTIAHGMISPCSRK